MQAPAEAAAPAVPKPKPQAKAGQSEEAKAREEFKRRADRNAAELAERRAKAARSSVSAEWPPLLLPVEVEFASARDESALYAGCNYDYC